MKQALSLTFLENLEHIKDNPGSDPIYQKCILQRNYRRRLLKLGTQSKHGCKDINYQVQCFLHTGTLLKLESKGNIEH